MKVLSGSWGILACASAIVSTVHAATVLDLQPTAASGDTVNYSVPTARGQIAAQARLISLNPSIGAWYLLEVPISGRSSETFHLEAPFMGTAVRLSAEGVEVQAPGVAPAVCDIFNPRSAHYIFRLAREGAPFTSVCGQSLFLRLDQSGAANTIKETGANVARSIGLEFLVDAYKDHLKADDNSVPVDVAGTDAAAGTDNGPREAEVAPSARARAVKLEKLDYDLEGKPAALHAGSWYRLDGLASAFFSFVRVGDAAPSILIERPDLVDPLTAKTRESVAYVVAFDLAQTTLGWAHGTSLPGVGNSPKVPSRGPGPDGFDRLAPLQTPGVVNPVYLSRLVGAFCGGFQREHGVQLGGPHAGQYNGFIEEGVVMSRMNRGLATIVVTKSGDVDVREWSAEDDANVANVRYARQNGLPLVSFDPAKNRYQPGLYVKESMSGYANWSDVPPIGSKRAKRSRTSERTAVCALRNDGRRYLALAYFASATPSSMARTLQAYGCETAIHLDMNSALQAYMGVVQREAGGVRIGHPVKEMAGIDGRINAGGSSTPVPWYASEPTKADYFYLLSKPR